jgi:hypothetical protein
MKIRPIGFEGVSPCSLTETRRRFRRTCCCLRFSGLLQLLKNLLPFRKSSRSLKNVDTFYKTTTRHNILQDSNLQTQITEDAPKFLTRTRVMLLLLVVLWVSTYLRPSSVFRFVGKWVCDVHIPYLKNISLTFNPTDDEKISKYRGFFFLRGPIKWNNIYYRLILAIYSNPIKIAARSKAWTVFALGSWDRGFESHSGHDCLVCVCVCVYAFI